jgi:hypothetical protein
VSLTRIRFDQQARISRLRRVPREELIDLREYARGKPCLLQFPLATEHNPETTVLCHWREGHFGMGCKPEDWMAVWGCFDCHNELDRRTQKLTLEQVELLTHRAFRLQMITYREEGIRLW